ncbi:DUF1127 domain-containing protein [Rhodobacteraceae bacterium N5(2021)]|uniref:DUF1127 domain-containing protein n=1 Tax=Gymnodinialimonas phycosphaerae TaxID=2841589 RepID=A0A975TT86_9RHOB|nr:DUF1127 domain-containing protein [Gymnodinialimonas phycosphaerae]MBY4894548.1 DUF1127 domain-containing protein [Gymnodinialimonas phycosphaerae]
MTDTDQATVRPRRRFRLPFIHWRAVWRSRRALSRLDAHLLRDIGVSDFDARQEAARPLWDAPEPWRGGT